jgi:hypothetical protein
VSRGGAAVAVIGALGVIAPLAGAPAGPPQGARAALAAQPAAGPDADSARAEARRILSGRRYTGTSVRGPFRGALEWLGRQLDRIGDLVPSLDRRVPGGRVITWIAILSVVGFAAWLVASQTARRRATAVVARAERAREGGRESPRAVERRADEAERSGDFATAVRLRFQAGLLRLDARGLIEYRPSLGTAAVARRLRSPDFDRVARDFDDIVYGGRPAGAADAAAAREGWAAIAKAAS